MGRRSLISLGAIGVVALLAAASMRHPFHVTIAQAEVAIKEDGHTVLEVALRVDPNELELALRGRTESTITLETSPEIDDLIVAYLDEVFEVRHPAPDDDSKPRRLEPCPPKTPEAESRPALTPPEDDEEPKPEPSIIRWVGKEIDIKYAWLYFEICLPESGIEGLEFSNRILFELEPKQANTINFREGDWRGSLRFTRDRARRVLSKKTRSRDEH